MDNRSEREKALSLSDLIGIWEFVAVYGKLCGEWVKGRTIKPGSIVWTFRADGTLLKQEESDPDRIELYEYDQNTGKLIIGKFKDEHYLFGISDNEAELYSLDFDNTLEKCKVKFRIKKYVRISII